MKPIYWNGVRINPEPWMLVDPAQAMAEVKHSHEWASRELSAVAPGSIREFCLTEERKRLAGIAWQIRRGL